MKKLLILLFVGCSLILSAESRRTHRYSREESDDSGWVGPLLGAVVIGATSAVAFPIVATSVVGFTASGITAGSTAAGKECSSCR